MTEITLSDYVGYIFKEIVQARKLSDQASKAIALEYAKDPILKEFSVPRFKIPELDLSIPVVVSGAKFTNLLSFNMTFEVFRKVVNTEMQNGIQNILIKKSGIRNDISQIGGIRNRDVEEKATNEPDTSFRPIENQDTGALSIEDLIIEFYHTIKNDLNQESVQNNSEICYAEIFNLRLQQTGLFADYKEQNPTNQLFNKMLENIVAAIKKSILIAHTKIDNLLVTPETNVVRNEASDTSVFTIKAKIIEDGLFIRSMSDGTQMVEFD